MRADEAEALFGQMLDGTMDDAAIIRTLIDMSDRGETAGEIAGAARAMRARMHTIKAPPNTIDVCGTGGDGHHTLNVSTAVAIVVAACGVPVAKHGNRAASSKAGAADTLEALGLNMQRAGETAEASLAELGICFLFAANHHPAMKRIQPLRQQIGQRTIFNLMGPLANPAGTSRQLLGIARPDYVPVYARAMTMLDTQTAWIVSGDEGLDEISTAGLTHVAAVTGSEIRTCSITPDDAGIPRHTLDALKGGEAAYNAAALRRLLLGTLETPQDQAYRDAVLLNAAAALMVAREFETLRDGVEEAAEAIDKGLAKALLDCWINFSV
ncbi:MAG: anthranilate phosphoribosyltransferase [Alphaproteobacteria bacterium]|nr:anthranilate phosphoribosyltransferase [Alphaproteobacteria bacterium]MDE2043058.1 anthranilate phosphoribosyltransferase [Alphaproteobacteria bacterium]MDE2341251.1 anthranilate phosphoribosyltransferase [Alphaproteobacteria bacterium]